MSLASSTDYGKDENAADKLLAKNKVLETDIQTYQGIVNGVDRECKRLFKTGCQDPNSLKKAQVKMRKVITLENSFSCKLYLQIQLIFPVLYSSKSLSKWKLVSTPRTLSI